MILKEERFKSWFTIFVGILALTTAVVLGITCLNLLSPKSQPVQAYNGFLEDCDFNGYDDETDAPVPWPGYDETHGDSIPSDWDGVAGSYATKHDASLGQGSSGTSTGNTSNSNNTNSNNSSSSSSNSSSTNSGTSSTAKEYSAELTPKSDEYIASLPQAVQDIIKVKGTLSFTGTALKTADNSGVGGRVEPGDSITIAGSGFAPNTGGFILKIYSTVLRLGTATTDAQGNFAFNTTIPADFEPGEHVIAVFYEDVILYKKTLQVGNMPVEAAATTVDQNSVPSSNNNLLLGGIILGALVIAGVAVFIVKSRRNKSTGVAADSSYVSSHSL